MESDESSKQFYERTQWLRKQIFDMAMPKKKGHVPSSFSQAEILVALYYGGILRYDSKNPQWTDRDRLIISKGHGAMAAYPILADLGFFPREELTRFTRKEGILRQYADNSIPGVECVTGSLGHGLGIAAGFAFDAKRKGKGYNSYVIISDGEYYEGSVVESARFAAHNSLDNLIAIVDRNGLIILGKTEELLRQEPVEKQWESLGWFTQRINGHSYNEIFGAFKNISAKTDSRPSVIIANTTKGKGVREMENNIAYHNKFPTPEKIEEFRRELDTNPVRE